MDTKTPHHATHNHHDSTGTIMLRWWRAACRLRLLFLPLLLVASKLLRQAQASSPILYRYNLSYTLTLPPAAAYEEAMLVATLSGLVNRDGPRLFTPYLPADEYWWEYMRARNFPPGVSNNDTTIINLPDLNALLDVFASVVQHSVILFDPLVPATSNVAQTAAGVWGVLPIGFRPEDPNSLYTRYVQSGPLQVKHSLVGQFPVAKNGTGSAKGDAYMWAIDTFLRGGGGGGKKGSAESDDNKGNKANPAMLAYFVDYFWTQVPNGSGHQGVAPSFDLHTVTNHDYFVAHKAFFFDLSVWADEAPNDDLGQPLGTDRKVFETLLRACYEGTEGNAMITIGGFTPWLFKYVGWKHEGVETEWETAKLVSGYNALLDADACCVGAMANAAFYQHYPLPERFVQQPAPTPDELVRKGYLVRKEIENPSPFSSSSQYMVAPNKGFYAFYAGDFDSSAWAYQQLHPLWNDPARGTVPVGWAVNPNLSKRFPLIFEMMYESLTPQDRMTTGDSGAGYLNPTQLFEPRASGLPDGSAVWKEWCLPFYQQFDLSFTGFLLNGKAGKMTHECQAFYTAFSPDGLTNNHRRSPDYPIVPSLEGNTPVFEEIDMPDGDGSAAAQVVLNRYDAAGQGAQFMIFRGTLKSPSFYAAVVEGVRALRPTLEAVEPLALSYLARLALGGHNDDRVTYVSDSLPRAGGRLGQVLSDVAFVVRNNGWNTLDLNELMLYGALSPLQDQEKAAETTRAAAPGQQEVNFVARASDDDDNEDDGGGASTARSIAPGAQGTLIVPQLTLPTTPGSYRLEYGLRRLGIMGRDFSSFGNPRYVCSVVMIGEHKVQFEIEPEVMQ